MISLEDSYIEQSSNIMIGVQGSETAKLLFCLANAKSLAIFYKLFVLSIKQSTLLHTCSNFLPKNSKMSLCPTNKQYCSYHDVVYYSFLTLLTTIILPSAVTMDTVPEYWSRMDNFLIIDIHLILQHLLFKIL